MFAPSSRPMILPSSRSLGGARPSGVVDSLECLAARRCNGHPERMFARPVARPRGASSSSIWRQNGCPACWRASCSTSAISHLARLRGAQGRRRGSSSRRCTRFACLRFVDLLDEVAARGLRGVLSAAIGRRRAETARDSVSSSARSSIRANLLPSGRAGLAARRAAPAPFDEAWSPSLETVAQDGLRRPRTPGAPPSAIASSPPARQAGLRNCRYPGRPSGVATCPEVPDTRAVNSLNSARRRVGAPPKGCVGGSDPPVGSTPLLVVVVEVHRVVRFQRASCVFQATRGPHNDP